MNHTEAWELIPWLVNHSLDEHTRARLEAHLDDCAECREEAQLQRGLVAAMHASPQVEAMPPASLHKLWGRIEPQGPGVAAAAPRDQRLLRSWSVAAVAAGAMLLGAVLALMLQSRPDDAYRTVSNAESQAASAGIRLVVAGDMTVGRLQTLLEANRLRIVSGSPGGVFTLAAAAQADPRLALPALRADPGVRFAEPVGN